MSDTIQLMWHPDLIKLFFQLKPQERITLLEGLNTGNLQVSFFEIKGTYNNKVLLAYTEYKISGESDWTGGDEWHQQFRDYLQLESVIVKPFEGYWDNAEDCWYLSKGTYGDIGYYLMKYCLVPIKNPQTINYTTLRI